MILRNARCKNKYTFIYIYIYIYTYITKSVWCYGSCILLLYFLLCSSFSSFNVLTLIFCIQRLSRTWYSTHTSVTQYVPSTTNIQSMWQIPSWGPSAIVSLLSVAILYVVSCVRIHGARPTRVSKMYQGADNLVWASRQCSHKISSPEKKDRST